jgi:uncharacterized protein YdaU (DUF1376 family)
MHYYQMHIGDYLAASCHLSHLEDLAYRRLIELYYKTEKPISCKCNANAMHVECIARAIRMQDCLGDVESVLNEFFDLEEDGYHNARCDAELSKIADLSTKRSEAAKTRWNANALQADCKSNATQDSKTPRSKTPKKKDTKKPDEQFLALWRMYGLRGTRKKAFEQWKKLSEEDQAEATKAIPYQIQETPDSNFRPYFERFLRDRVWEGVLERKANNCLNIPERTGKHPPLDQTYQAESVDWEAEAARTNHMPESF